MIGVLSRHTRAAVSRSNLPYPRSTNQSITSATHTNKVTHQIVAILGQHPLHVLGVAHVVRAPEGPHPF
jgi:hypothetical protein